LYWVDALRAIAIFFVVFGHMLGSFLFGEASGISRWLLVYILSFHMPLFFFLSGFLLKEETLHSAFITYLGKRFRSIMIPYFVFAFLTYIPWVLVTRHYGYQAELDINPLTPLLGIIYGTHKGDWLIHNAPLWFFTCLFVTQIAFYWIARLSRKPLIAVILVIAAVLGYLDFKLTSFRSPWSTDIALTAIVFYGVGHLLKSNPVIIHKPKAIITLLLLVTILGLQTLSLKFNTPIAMGFREYGNFGLFFLGSFSGTLFWVIVVKFIPVSRAISRVGKDSIVIFSLHVLAISVITGVAVWILRLPLDFAEGSLFIALLYTVISIAMLIPVAYIIRRYVPWVIGGR
jgi:acyltransferase